MIILAAAVILALSSNGIIGKANKAKIGNDEASLKEYVNVLKAEWELMPENITKTSLAAYVNQNLDEKGYTNVVLSEDGELYFGLEQNVRKAIKDGLKIGDKVEYIVESREKETSGDENNGTKQTISNMVNFTYKFIGINEDGKIEIIPELLDTSPKIVLSGTGGYLKGIEELNNICSELYTVENKGIARSMNIEDAYKLLEYIPTIGGYYDGNGKYTQTSVPLTIGEIIEKNGENAITGQTPDGSDINTYVANYHYIYKTNNKITKNEIKKDLVYQENVTYWLATTCNYVHFKSNFIYYSLFIVYPHIVNASNVFLSNRGPASRNWTLRPVIELNTNLKLSFNRDEALWSLV